MHAINLLPWREGQQVQLKRNRLMAVSIGILLAVVWVAVIHFYLQSRISHLQQDVMLEQVTLAKQQSQQAEWDQKKIALAEVQNRERQHILFLTQLKKLSDAAIAHVYLTELRFIKNRMEVSGVAFSMNDFTEFYRASHAVLLEEIKPKGLSQVMFRLRLSRVSHES